MSEANLPGSWERQQIDVCCDLNPRLDKAAVSDSKTVHFVPMPAVEALTNRVDVTTTRPFAEVKKGYTPFASGDVIFAKITPCMENGKIAVVPDLDHGIALGSTEFHVIRPRCELPSLWFFHYVSSRAYRSKAEHNMTGAVGQRRVPIDFIAQSKIPLPPLAEQRRIVAKIEELFSELNAGEENLRRARRQLGVYRQSLLKQAFEGKLTEQWREQNPEGCSTGWHKTTVGEIGRIETGTTPPTANPRNYGDELPFFKPTDLEQGQFVKTAREHLSESGKQCARVLPRGSILVTCIGATIGKTGLAQVMCATNQQINSISPDCRGLSKSGFNFPSKSGHFRQDDQTG
jgi:type I restriction enzyme S subunit